MGTSRLREPGTAVAAIPEAADVDDAAAADGALIPEAEALSGGAGVTPDSSRTGCGVMWRGSDSCTAAGTEPELATAARPVSVSRFKRCRSVRMSAAFW